MVAGIESGDKDKSGRAHGPAALTTILAFQTILTQSRDCAPRWTPLSRVLPCEIDVLFVLARWHRVMIAYFRGEVTACQTSKNEVEASAVCEKQAPAHVRELHLSFLFLTALQPSLHQPPHSSIAPITLLRNLPHTINLTAQTSP